ncbi:purple acid phosphatase family protein [Fibrella aquatilis]|uniref:Metallophosphoesterase n=1 Tax=Fibrella aquatilis TaxID=2817059 RepID=A0A939G6S1_9BACT|nr:metallophosphoesterase [Fibrella aquatilis]MBO0933214.1 metallophosphoesterase [Fibrella aquatilis]
MRKLLLLFLFFTLTLVSCAQNKASDKHFFTRPYLQIGKAPSPTSLQLLWHTTDADAEWRVEYRPDSTTAWLSSPPPTHRRITVSGIRKHRVYHAALTGLIPGTLFNYRVLKAGNVVFSATGHAPKTTDQPYRFVAFADIGAETGDQKRLAYQAYQANPDLVVVPGDIVYDYGLAWEYRTKFWPIYNADKANSNGAPLMRSVPMVAAPGNHDTEVRNLDEKPDALAYYYYWNQPLNGPVGQEGGPLVPPLIATKRNRAAFTEAAGNNYPRMTNYSFDYGNAHWTIIDSNPYVNFTDSTLLNWVKKDLAAAQGATWRFVMYHHPSFSSSRTHFEQQQMRLLCPLLEAGKVDVVFNGHVHNYQRTAPLRFVPNPQGVQLIASMGNRTYRGRAVNGRWTLDKAFDGKTNTTPNGIVYVITGAGGQILYDQDQTNEPGSYQEFTTRFIANVHSLTVADVAGNTLKVKQLTSDGKEIDSFTITK